MLGGSYDCGLLAFSESSESAHFPWLGIHDKDSLNIELNFGYEQTITHPFPKGTWISIEMSENFDPDLKTTTHILKLNNDVVYTKERFNQPNKITKRVCLRHLKSNVFYLRMKFWIDSSIETQIS